MPSHAAYYVLQPPPPPAPLRSVDEHGLALMMSLQQPKHPPTWWGKERAALQVGSTVVAGGWLALGFAGMDVCASSGRLLGPASPLLCLVPPTQSLPPTDLPHSRLPPTLAGPQAKCARMLESNPVHYFIIGLTILDLMIVVTELVLSSFYPVHEEVPHAGGRMFL